MRYIIFLLSTLVAIVSQAQPADYWVTLYVNVVDGSGQPVANTDLTLTPKAGTESLHGITDRKGKVTFMVQNGKSYTLAFDDGQTSAQITIPRNSQSFITQKVTYNRPASLTNRPAGMLDTIQQKLSAKQDATAAEDLVVVILKNRQKKAIPNIQVRLRCDDIGRVYVATSDSEGKARFLVSPNKTYHIDLDDLFGFSTFKLPVEPGYIFEREVLYVPTNVDETIANDTVIQNLPPASSATSSRAYMKMTVTDYNRAPLPNEWVFMDVKNSDTVYAALTDNKGEVQFLLPKGFVYSLHLVYDRDIDEFDIPRGRGLYTSTVEYTYMGTQNINNYYKQTKRDKNGFLTEFNSTPIEKATADKASYYRRTQQGYMLNFASDSKSASPVITDDAVITHNGVHEREVFCVESSNADFRWGVRLTEAGPSALVYADGVLLINTESCTLYAIDVATGELLWSKWLSPFVYSSPTANNGKVFTVYENRVFDRKTGKSLGEGFVAVAFDLKTGNIVWQNWIDQEPLGAPVVANDKAYFSTQNGTLYQFDANNGTLLNKKQIKTVAPPTVTNNEVYATVRQPKDSTKQQIVILDVNTLSQIAVLAIQPSPVLFKSAKDIGFYGLMNYAYGRVLQYNSLNYVLSVNNLTCTRPQTGELVWTQQITDSLPDNNTLACLMPVAADGKIIVGIHNTIKIFDAQKGTKLSEYVCENEVFATPVLYNGWILAGLDGGATEAINTQNPKITGWTQWGGNASHNSVINER